MVRSAVVLLALFLLAGPASAAEVTPLELTGYDSCVRTTGVPGQLVVPTDGGARFVQAAVSGFTLGQNVELGNRESCPEAAARENGAAAVAASTADGMTVAVRDPGGVWGAAQTIVPDDGQARIFEPTVSVSDRGDVLVAWWEETGPLGSDARDRLRVARRAPGGGFGAPETLVTGVRESYALMTGLAGDGQAFVLWATDDATTAPIQVPVRLATAAAGARLTTTDVGLIPWRSQPSLAVAADGRALIALPGDAAVRVLEREPGGTFGAPTTLATVAFPGGVRAQVALDNGGRAAVAWLGAVVGGLQIATRTGPGAFGAPQTLAAATTVGDPFYLSEAYYAYSLPTGWFSTVGSPQQLVLTPDGHAAYGRRLGRRLAGAPTVGVALDSVPLAGGPPATQRAGGEFADADYQLGIVLPDGRPGVVWTESVPSPGLEPAAFRLHLLSDGSTAPTEPAVPNVRVGTPKRTVLDRDGTLRFPVTCSGACIVRAQVVGGVVGEDTVRLAKAGTTQLVINGGGPEPVAPLHAKPVRFRISWGAPTTVTPHTRTLSLRLHRRADPPDPKVVGLRAVRHGDRIQVSWRTDRKTTYSLFWVTGAATPGLAAAPLKVRETEGRHGRRTFSLNLTHAGAVRYVTLRVQHVTTGHDPKPVTLHVG